MGQVELLHGGLVTLLSLKALIRFVLNLVDADGDAAFFF